MTDHPNSSGARDAAAPDERATAIRFVTHDVTPEETAAVTAVLLAVLDEAPSSAALGEPRRGAWVRSAGAVRTPIAVGPGEWVRSAR